jgi:hypothetical protein
MAPDFGELSATDGICFAEPVCFLRDPSVFIACATSRWPPFAGSQGSHFDIAAEIAGEDYEFTGARDVGGRPLIGTDRNRLLDRDPLPPSPRRWACPLASRMM